MSFVLVKKYGERRRRALRGRDPLSSNPSPAWPSIVEANSEGSRDRWDPASGVLIHGVEASQRVGGSGAHCSSVTVLHPAPPPPPPQAPWPIPICWSPGRTLSHCWTQISEYQDTLLFNGPDGVCLDADRHLGRSQNVNTHPSVHKLSTAIITAFCRPVGCFSLWGFILKWHVHVRHETPKRPQQSVHTSNLHWSIMSICLLIIE